nr:hypothetical protein [uncultured Rhodopila sp.]
MTLNSLKKLAQDAIGTVKDRVEKATATVGNAATGAAGSARSIAPPSLDDVVRSLSRTATEAANALRETKFVRPIVDGVNTVVDTSNRIARAAHAAREAYAAEPRGKQTPDAPANPAAPPASPKS